MTATSEVTESPPVMFSRPRLLIPMIGSAPAAVGLAELSPFCVTAAQHGRIHAEHQSDERQC